MDTVQELVALIQTNQERFYRIAYTYVKNREDALDLVHDAVVKALQSCPALKNPAYMRTWFYRILINESLSFLRKRKNVLSWEEIPAQAAPDARQEEYIDLYAAIDKLPADLGCLEKGGLHRRRTGPVHSLSPESVAGLRLRRLPASGGGGAVPGAFVPGVPHRGRDQIR